MVMTAGHDLGTIWARSGHDLGTGEIGPWGVRDDGRRECAALHGGCYAESALDITHLKRVQAWDRGVSRCALQPEAGVGARGEGEAKGGARRKAEGVARACACACHSPC